MVNHNTSGGLTLGTPEARIKRRSNQSDARFDSAKTRWNTTLDQRAVDGKVASFGGGAVGLNAFRWRRGYTQPSSLASPGPPPLRSRKFHPGAEVRGTSGSYNTAPPEKTRNNNNKKEMLNIHFFIPTQKYRKSIIEKVFISQTKF